MQVWREERSDCGVGTGFSCSSLPAAEVSPFAIRNDCKHPDRLHEVPVLIGADQMQIILARSLALVGNHTDLGYSKSSALICRLQNTVYKVISLSEDPVASDDKGVLWVNSFIILPAHWIFRKQS